MAHRTEPYPFVVGAIPAGALVDERAVEFREVPIGLLGPPAEPGSVASRSLEPGEPWSLAVSGGEQAIPAGWWSVPVDLPESAQPGQRVRLVATQPPLDVLGVVTETPQTGAFAVTTPGLVAVPPEHADVVAMAAATGGLVVLLATS